LFDTLTEEVKMKKYPVLLITALYAAALKVLDLKNSHNQFSFMECAMSYARRELIGDGYGCTTREIFEKARMPEADFDSIWYNYTLSREQAANALRDLADKYATENGDGTMNVKDLLATARYIETHADEYKQGSVPSCIMGIYASRVAGHGHVYRAQTELGLTSVQFRTLFHFGSVWNANGKPYDPKDENTNFGAVNYADFDALPAQEKADMAAARIRQLVLTGE
jgi:hypothetical protein